MRVVILGAGRLGGLLIESLIGSGREVAVVERDLRVLERLEKIAGVEALSGDLFDEPTLTAAFAKPCDLFIAITGNDPHNILAAQLVKRRFKVPRVLMRLTEPELAQVYRQLGFEAICPAELALDELKQLLGV
jgi:trk system potassium uptake protein TrkA